MTNKTKNLILLIGMMVFVLFLLSFLIPSKIYFNKQESKVSANTLMSLKSDVVMHIKTPEEVKGVYMTQCVASMPKMRENIIKLIEETELNSIVVDIKDYTGTVSFETGDIEIDKMGGKGCKVADMKDFIKELHDKNIYVIGRLTVFQDSLYANKYPDFAVKKKSDGKVWKDRKGISFVDVGSRPFWDYILKISNHSYDIGFDEINFDYIRFPSDGDMKDIYFSQTGTTTKKEMLRQFFEYLDLNLSGRGIVTSADIFGMTTTNTDDLNIGQILEYALINFDYVSPMVYPSHYPPNFNGWSDPNKVPYEIIEYSIGSAVARANSLREEIINKMYTDVASSSKKIKNNFYNEKLEKRLGAKQLRPWLQDFNYPIAYTPQMVRKQINAVYGVGLKSWLLWDPANTYTREALLSK